ncbi:uncharacterized protein LOC111703967 [Eurytemora carolleeae]|uniref:uncharacterized protein LOC111703967 n=1 Tax=Eurytemora carolleeae TaxID=1294199 RepID=UPI000C77239E|nr:uncharacterized protein LOC111703967 [Eurytemora carolleeae]|eukprot:XP_023331836.1 uncharacterized protein LOC111703967 [Eurytemora affinis]
MAGIEDLMDGMRLGRGRIKRGRGGRVQGGWSRGGRGGGWGRGGGGIGDDDLRHRINQASPEDLRNRLEKRTNYEEDRRERLLGREEKSTKPKKNTENFTPSHEPSQMRIIAVPAGLVRYNREVQTRDVLLVSDLFCKPADLYLYNKLMHELSESGLTEHQIWASWHGDSHLIANDQTNWKKHCPTFHMVLDKIADYFNMDIKATRLNWYRNSSEWKPFHHDAAAIKEEKAKQSNLTVAVSFGLERDAAFEHAKTKTIISSPQPNGSVYVFGRDINVLWRHGILQMPPEKAREEGRVSVIAWGWADQVEV